MSKNDQNNALETKGNQGNSLTTRENDMGFGLNPANLQEAIKICEYLAGSSMVPKNYQNKPQDILVAINFGSEVGLKPLQSLNSVAVVNGNPSLWGDAPLGLVKQSPGFEYILEDNEAFAYARDNISGWEHLKEIDPDSTSICVVKRKGQPPLVREFSDSDVKRAGLGNVHKSYPKTMRKYRARSRGLRDAFPDVLKGLQQAEINEETEAMIDAGIYDDLNKRNEVPQQPEKREEIDIDMSNQKPDGSSETEEVQDHDLEVDRDHLMEEITAKAKDHWGNKDAYGKIKKCVIRIDPNADNMLGLKDEGLLDLHDRIMGMEKIEDQEA